MRQALLRAVTVLWVARIAVLGIAPAHACGFDDCGSTDFGDGDVGVGYSGPEVGRLVAGSPAAEADYAWRLRRLCVIADEQTGTCSGQDFRQCPQAPGRIFEYLVVEQRPVARADGTSVLDPQTATGLPPGTQVGV